MHFLHNTTHYSVLKFCPIACASFFAHFAVLCVVFQNYVLLCRIFSKHRNFLHFLKKKKDKLENLQNRVRQFPKQCLVCWKIPKKFYPILQLLKFFFFRFFALFKKKNWRTRFEIQKSSLCVVKNLKNRVRQFFLVAHFCIKVAHFALKIFYHIFLYFLFLNCLFFYIKYFIKL
jgi:hypothetical protein